MADYRFILSDSRLQMDLRHREGQRMNMQWLHDWKKSQGMSDHELSAMLGVAQSTLTHLWGFSLSQRSSVSQKTRIRIANEWLRQECQRRVNAPGASVPAVMREMLQLSSEIGL